MFRHPLYKPIAARLARGHDGQEILLLLHRPITAMSLGRVLRRLLAESAHHVVGNRGADFGPRSLPSFSRIFRTQVTGPLV